MSRYKGLLPIVMPEAVFLLIQELDLNGGYAYIDKIIDRLSRDNSVVSDYINKVSSDNPHGYYNTMCCVSLYRMLEMQGILKKQKLPVVKKAIIEVVFRDAKMYPIQRINERLYEDNPVILSYRKGIAENDPNNKDHIIESCIMLYRILESQADADDLEKRLPKFDQ